MIINDGTGTGQTAGVNGFNRLLVDANTQAAITTSTALGTCFKLGTGNITLTSATVSAVFYLKNNEDLAMIVSEILLSANQSTGGTSGIGTWIINRNPTGGTIISTATPLSIRQNFNFGSTRPLVADAFKGVEGATITGGNDFTSQSGFQVPNRVVAPFSSVIIPRGATLAVTFTPPTSNTSIVISVEMSAFLAAV
jgi:hypothetical protein